MAMDALTTRRHSAGAPPSAVGLTDPVCGMAVTPKSFHWLDHGGQRVYFCSAGCKTRFAADPAKYLKPPAQNEPVAAAAIYTCPMHPEVRQDHPGACPKCGMALEPLLPTVDEGENPELSDFQRRMGRADGENDLALAQRIG